MTASPIMEVWFVGRLKYCVAYLCTTGSISIVVVWTPWAMSAEGDVPTPKPL